MKIIIICLSLLLIPASLITMPKIPYRHSPIKWEGSMSDLELRKLDETKKDTCILLERIKGYSFNIDEIYKLKNVELAKANREIQQKNKELNVHREHLEEIVRERTKELISSNKQLKREIHCSFSH